MREPPGALGCLMDAVLWLEQILQKVSLQSSGWGHSAASLLQMYCYLKGPCQPRTLLPFT